MSMHSSKGEGAVMEEGAGCARVGLRIVAGGHAGEGRVLGWHATLVMGRGAGGRWGVEICGGGAWGGGAGAGVARDAGDWAGGGCAVADGQGRVLFALSFSRGGEAAGLLARRSGEQQRHVCERQAGAERRPQEWRS